MAGGVGIPIKVTRICDGKIWFYAPDLVFEDGDDDESCSIGLDCEGHECTGFIEKLTVKNYNEEYFDERFVDATKLHVLNDRSFRRPKTPIMLFISTKRS